MTYQYDSEEVVNIDDIQPGEYDLAPRGDYEVTLIGIQRTINKQGTGEYLKIEVVVDSDHCQNKHFWDNLSVIHEKEKTRNIARQQFKQLCIACNVTWNAPFDQDLLDSTFIGKQFVVYVDIEPGTGGYPDKNAIKKYLPPRNRPVTAVTEKQMATMEKKKGSTAVDLDDDNLPW